MTEQQKEIIKAHVFGYSDDEIAKIERVSPMTVVDAILLGKTEGYIDEIRERRDKDDD